MIGSPCSMLTNLVLLWKWFWFLPLIQHTVKTQHYLKFIIIIIPTKTNWQLSLLRWQAVSVWSCYPTFLKLSLSPSSQIDVLNAVLACCISTTRHALGYPRTHCWRNSGQSQRVSGVLSQNGLLEESGWSRAVNHRCPSYLSFILPYSF